MNGHITIVGLGPGNPNQLSLGAWEALKTARRLILRTAVHPTASLLTEHGIRFESCDDLYDNSSTFGDVYEKIVQRLLVIAADEPVTYAVPGHPLVGEDTVQELLRRERRHEINITVVPSMSALDAIFASVRIDPVLGLQVLDALSFNAQKYNSTQPTLFLQIYNRFTASQLKLALMEVVSEETPVVLVRAAGVENVERVAEVALYEIDRYDWVDHLTSLYIPPCPLLTPVGSPVGSPVGADTDQKPADVANLQSLLTVMEQLRSPNGCPWDRQQTHATLKKYLIEESYEVLDAIDKNDMPGLAEELGDVLLQVVFHAQLAKEEGTFDITDVIRSITEKMIRRHPHVFADVDAPDAAAVLRNWEQIKQTEKAATSAPASLLSGVPGSLPALMQAAAVQKKAAKVGFEWDEVAGAMDKVHEEAAELQAAYESGNQADIAAELGDLLFALVNVSRYLDVDAEEALRGTTGKFMRRFRHIEEQAAASGRTLADMTLVEMDQLWDEAKHLERKS